MDKHLASIETHESSSLSVPTNNYYEVIAGLLAWQNFSTVNRSKYNGYTICHHYDGGVHAYKYDPRHFREDWLVFPTEVEVKAISVADLLKEIDGWIML